MSSLSLSGLWIYPVKSLGGIALNASLVEERGLQYDRRWMVVDENGLFVTQRQHPRMATLRTALDEVLRITALTGESIQLPLQSEGPSRTVHVWRDDVEAVDCGEEVATFLSDSLGVSCRLVGMTATSERSVDTRYVHHGGQTSFSDGYPFLVVGQASLDDLNDRLQEKGEGPVEIERFRPNFLFRGGAPYEEDEWRVFRVGGVEFEVVKPCSRCVITTLDHRSGEKRGNEPLQTLSQYRRTKQGVLFAQNAVALTKGAVQIGDTIEVVTHASDS